MLKPPRRSTVGNQNQLHVTQAGKTEVIQLNRTLQSSHTLKKNLEKKWKKKKKYLSFIEEKQQEGIRGSVWSITELRTANVIN